MHFLTDPESWIALATLTAIEIVLGIDNIIFISILTGRLPEHRRRSARASGLGAAMIMRLLLLFSLVWLMGLTEPLFTLMGEDFSWRDMILIAGGLFLIGKSTLEIHEKLEGVSEEHATRRAASFAGVIAQIMVLDIVFSLDSVITAVGMARDLPVMAAAVVLAVLVMLASSEAVSDFVEGRPTVKMLALSFLLLIGVTLIADGLGLHIPKGYIYFAMAFSVFVEMLNLKIRGRAKPVRLKKPPLAEAE